MCSIVFKIKITFAFNITYWILCFYHFIFNNGYINNWFANFLTHKQSAIVLVSSLPQVSYLLKVTQLLRTVVFSCNRTFQEGNSKKYGDRAASEVQRQNSLLKHLLLKFHVDSCAWFSVSDVPPDLLLRIQCLFLLFSSGVSISLMCSMSVYDLAPTA